MSPHWAWPNLKLAQLLLEIKTDLPEAETTIDRAIALAKSARERAEGYLLKAQILLAQGLRPKALEAVVECLLLRPDWDWAKHIRGRISQESTPAAV